MSNEREEIAEILRQHRYDRVKAVCECSDEVQVGLRCDPETHEQHAADVLLAAGYRKPRTITTREELEELHEGAVVVDSSGDVAELRGGEWCSYETAPMTFQRMAKYLPASLIHEGVSK